MAYTPEIPRLIELVEEQLYEDQEILKKIKAGYFKKNPRKQYTENRITEWKTLKNILTRLLPPKSED